jgi:hypothetical protein
LDLSKDLYFMNKYLVKIADSVNITTPGKTAIKQSIAGILPDVGGIAVGNVIGKNLKLVHGSHNFGGMAGGVLGGLAANYAVLNMNN